MNSGARMYPIGLIYNERIDEENKICRSIAAEITKAKKYRVLFFYRMVYQISPLLSFIVDMVYYVEMWKMWL